MKVAELDRVKHIYHFGDICIHENYIRLDVYGMQFEVITQLQLAYVGVMVSFCNCCREA